jgi:serine protease Do
MLCALLAALALHGAPAAELPDFTALVREQSGAVVNISIAYRVPWEVPEPPLSDSGDEARVREFIEHFFGPRGPQHYESRSLGSGFVVSEDGYIITNAHLVSEGEPRDIVVRLADRREFDARVVGFDLESDVGLLKIDAHGLKPVRIGEPGELQVGEWVAAIGSPFGFDSSVTAGIVSGKARTLPEAAFIAFIQTDVAVNPGNSGGPLFNLRGEVVAVNSLIYSETGGYMGMSFAIPIDYAMEIADQLKAGGKVKRGALAIRVQEVTADLAAALHLPRPAGALVSDLQKPDAPAGLRPGDVIVRFDGRPVETSADLMRLTARARPGTRVELEFVRNGKLASTQVLIGEMRSDEGAARAEERKTPEPLGLELAALTDAERQRLGVGGGLVVKSAQNAAARAGLRAGDVILSVDGVEIGSVEAFRRRIAGAGGSTLALRVQRGNVRLYLALRVAG